MPPNIWFTSIYTRVHFLFALQFVARFDWMILLCSGHVDAMLCEYIVSCLAIELDGLLSLVVVGDPTGSRPAKHCKAKKRGWRDRASYRNGQASHRRSACSFFTTSAIVIRFYGKDELHDRYAILMRCFVWVSEDCDKFSQWRILRMLQCMYGVGFLH